MHTKYIMFKKKKKKSKINYIEKDQRRKHTLVIKKKDQTSQKPCKQGEWGKMFKV